MSTKQQERREGAYRKQLKRCGFRSWKQANQRRCELIDRDISGEADEEEQSELKQLQKLCDLYVKWKTNDALGRSTRRAKRLLKKLEESDD